MSKLIATRAIRGANAAVAEASALLEQAIEQNGAQAPVAFPNTAYALPVINGMLNREVTCLGDLPPVLEHARRLLHPVPEEETWTPYLGDALDCGTATLLVAEAIQGIRFALGLEPAPYPGLPEGHLNGPIEDVQLRSWGIQLVDGSIVGAATIVGAARNTEAAVHIVRELQRRNILTFLCGNVNGRSIIDQLHEAEVEMGYDTYLVPFGRDTIAAIYALGFATRAAMTFGGLKPGQWDEILAYNTERVMAFVLALGEVDDLKCAAAAGALTFGFPVIADTIVPEIAPSGITPYEAVVSEPWNEINASTDEERAAQLVQRAVDVRGIKVRITEVPVPVPYGSAFEGEVVRRADMRIEFGGKQSRAFEYLLMRPMDEVEDGQIELIGPDYGDQPVGGSMDLGMVIEVAGREMEADFEPVLERQIHDFINAASGIQHIGQRDIVWMRISQKAAENGFDLRHFGEILYARIHGEFGTIADKVQVTIITDPHLHAEWLEKARAAFDFRNRRLADLTDEAVDTFYSCTLCQSFAPTHVCIVSPERLGLCGAYNWLDCKASHQINATGPNQPIKKGEVIDAMKGYWEGVNAVTEELSRGAIDQVAMYSIVEKPMTACGCFECIVMVIPELDGVMVVSREDPSMTPAGMTFSTLAGMCGGGIQTPGVMGVGKFYLLSPKFISADGGLKRVVWMSSNLKQTMAGPLAEAAQREGVTDLMERVADERSVTTVEELTEWVRAHDHPVLQMGPMEAGSAAGIEETEETEPAQPAPPKPTPPQPEPTPPTPEPEPAPPAPAPRASTPWRIAQESMALHTEDWSGQVREVTLGATPAEGGTRSASVTVGGQNVMPFLDFEGQIPHRPAVAIEIQDRRPDDWSPLLEEAWGDPMDDPATWAQAAETQGADLLTLQLSLNRADGKPNTPENARAIVRRVLEATGLPLIVLGPGQTETDNDLLVAVAEEAAGERLLLGACEEKNYRTIVAAALAHDHRVLARASMDVNLSKQLNILIGDIGLPMEQIVMDPTCAAVGYGMEYGYSVMERLRLAALQGDRMVQLPMLVTVGEEAWRQKESRFGQGMPETWGDWRERAINWETLTATALLEAGADILVLRHPDSMDRIRQSIDELMS